MNSFRACLLSFLAVSIVGCGGGTVGSHPDLASGHGSQPDAAAPVAWRIPTGWTAEIIPFPLSFAPTLDHSGTEELRFPPGVFEPSSTNYWAYAFAWRTEDSATLDAAQLGDELTAYYRGLLTSVDTGHLITMPDAIVAQAQAMTDGPGFTFTAQLFDAFNGAVPVGVTGSARRLPCGSGAVWVFDLSPKISGVQPIRGELDELAGEAACGQVPTS